MRERQAVASRTGKKVPAQVTAEPPVSSVCKNKTKPTKRRKKNKTLEIRGKMRETEDRRDHPQAWVEPGRRGRGVCNASGKRRLTLLGTQGA